MSVKFGLIAQADNPFWYLCAGAKGDLRRLTPFCFFVYSDEDTDVKSLVSSWLKSQSEERRSQLATWIEDSFYSALKWVLSKDDQIVTTSLVGLVLNGLSHLRSATCKEEFACALVRSLGSNLSEATMGELMKEVRWTKYVKLFQWLSCWRFFAPQTQIRRSGCGLNAPDNFFTYNFNANL